jgi:hypothetical protein
MKDLTLNLDVDGFYHLEDATDGKSAVSPNPYPFVMIITIQLLKYLVKVRNSSQDRS